MIGGTPNPIDQLSGALDEAAAARQDEPAAAARQDEPASTRQDEPAAAADDALVQRFERIKQPQKTGSF